MFLLACARLGGGNALTVGSKDMVQARGTRLRRKNRDLMKDMMMFCCRDLRDEVKSRGSLMV